MGVMDAVREASRGPYPVVSEVDTIVEVDTSEATEAATGGQGSYPTQLTCPFALDSRGA